MATFTPSNKSAQGSFANPSKDADTWVNIQHSDIEGVGFDVQTFDDPNTGFDQAGNVLLTSWTVINKEIG